MPARQRQASDHNVNPPTKRVTFRIGEHGGAIVQVFFAPAAENEPFRFNGWNDHPAG
jgi:hypothetical protein